MNETFPEPPNALHLIGITGQGMTALAHILQQQGYTISGSDVPEHFPTDPVLKSLQIYRAENFSPDNIPPNTVGVIYSTAYPVDHSERQAARNRGIPEWSYPEVVRLLFTLYPKSISVAGSHGKTTTTSILGHILESGGLDPTVIIGGTDIQWKSNARAGHSDWFVLETDEFQDKLRQYSPRYVLLTNVDYDHPDFFPDRQRYEEAFIDFVSRIPEHGVLVLWGQEPLKLSLQSVLKSRLVTYGTEPTDDWYIHNVRIQESGTSFSLHHKQKSFGDFTIPFPGEQYALNAAGAIAMAHVAGVKGEAMLQAVRYFRGTVRRMEVKGQYHGATVIDDYAHHPTEIVATLKACRLRYPNARLIVLFHAHTFTRTQAFLSEFVEALSLADKVYLPPIFGSAREERGTITSAIMAENINSRSADKAMAVDSLGKAQEILEQQLSKNDVLITMGAGDSWEVADALVSRYVQ